MSGSVVMLIDSVEEDLLIKRLSIVVVVQGRFKQLVALYLF